MKDPLEYLNDVKIDLSQYEDIELNDIEKMKMKISVRKAIAKNSKGKRSLKSVAKVSGLVAGVMVCTVALGVCFPAYAENIPVLGGIIEFLNRNDEIRGYEESAEFIDKTISTEGYEITIQSAYYNARELTIAYSVRGEKSLDKKIEYIPYLEIDTDNKFSYNWSLLYSEFLDNTTFSGLIKIDINNYDGSKLPEVLRTSIDVTKLLIGEDWDKGIKIKSKPIELALDSNKVKMNVKSYDINKTITYNENTIEVIKAKEYPTEFSIETKINSSEDVNIDYFVWDSTRGPLKAVPGYNEDYLSDNQSAINYQLPGASAEVFIIPYVFTENKEANIGKEKIKVDINEGEYDFGKAGKVEILAVKDVSNTTEIKVRLTGYQANPYFYFEGDSEREFYKPCYIKERKINGILDMEATYVFDKLDKSKNYYFAIDHSTNFELLDEEIIKIK